jgi:membrane-associated protein
MTLASLSQQILAYAGTLNIWLALAMFVLLILAEFSISPPYIMEGIWILVGYHAALGNLPVYQVIILMLIAVGSRMLGAIIFYNLAGLGRGPIMRIYDRLFGTLISARLSESNEGSRNLLVKFIRRINLLSPFSVALGRLLWVRVPLTILLSMRRQLRTLLLAVILSSVVWDTTYILIGVIGGNAKLDSLHLILYSLIGLTVIYGGVFVARKVAEWRMSRT